MDFDKRKLGSASFIDSFTSTLDLFVIIATLAALIYLTVVTVVVTTGGICTAHNISSWQMCTSATCAKRN
jgi:myosin-crossreactive antigen